MLGFCVYAFLMWLFFSMNGGHRDIEVWIKILGFVGMVFIDLRVTSKKSVPEPSVYNY